MFDHLNEKEAYAKLVELRNTTNYSGYATLKQWMRKQGWDTEIGQSDFDAPNGVSDEPIESEPTDDDDAPNGVSHTDTEANRQNGDLKKEKEKPRFIIQTAKELAESDLKPIEWIVEDLLPKGLTMLSGDAKIGKSFMALHMGIAIAHGGVVFSRFPVVEPKPTIYMALEDAARSIKSRLDIVQPDGDIPNNLGLIYQSPIFLNTMGFELIKEQLIDEGGAEVIIVDTRKHLVPNANYLKGTSYDNDYDMQAPIHAFAHEHNISLILITHNKKGRDLNNVNNNMQGSMGVQSACDTMMNVQKTDGIYTLHVVSREMPEVEYPMEFKDGLWVAQTLEEQREQKLSDIRNVIDRLLKDNEDGLTSTEITQMAETEYGLSPPNVRNALSRMRKSGQVNQPKSRGRYYYVSMNGMHVTGNGDEQLHLESISL